MRPVERGVAPREYKKYGDATPDLLKRIGEFCSYCEKRLVNAPELEHILPKKHHPELETDWNNFLLACKSCNTSKSDTDFSLKEACLPNIDNSFLAFLYCKGGVVKINPLLDEEQKRFATKTIELLKLDFYPGFKEPSERDYRWQQRQEAWEVAETAKVDFEALKGSVEHEYFAKVENKIVQLMYHTGFWSVWMTVFDDDPHMRQRFIDAIQGTHKDSFDANTRPLPRGKI